MTPKEFKYKKELKSIGLVSNPIWKKFIMLKIGRSIIRMKKKMNKNVLAI